MIINHQKEKENEKMNIYDAVKKALPENKYIRRKSVNSGMLESKVLIKPTNSYDCCVILIIGDNEKRQSRFWNPTADDLMADDWEVTMV